ncbi:DUF4097 family beta strand repeat-containing protein [Algoriphagus sp. AK58]|uniref:DUF4097 family beta strand repeat-containing protein n=1 Tax=Algoriphagus sp. AK58 TaxID=1406877 RepID=UPI0016508432|nr:DUF4097 family beta strand repeat-containing protein [Algoriphagus sp. AK58]MBC6365219.1 hypothetical protein [Algoriphagus sp. AK58]
MKIRIVWLLLFVPLFIFSCNLDQVRDQQVYLEVDYLTYLEINPGGLEVRIIGDQSLNGTVIESMISRDNEFSPLLRVNRQFGRIVLDLDNIRNNVNPTSGYIEIRSSENFEWKVVGGSNKISILNLDAKRIQVEQKSGEIALENIKAEELLIRQDAGIFTGSKLESANFFLNLLGGSGTIQNCIGTTGVFTEGGRITVQNVGTMSLAAANSPGGLVSLQNVELLRAASAGRGEVRGENVGLANRVELNAAGGKVDLSTSTDISGYGYLFNLSPGSVSIGEKTFNSSVSDFTDGQPLLFGSIYSGSVSVKSSF